MSEPVKFYAFDGVKTKKKRRVTLIKKEHPLKTVLRLWCGPLTLLIAVCGFFLTGAGFLDSLYPFGLAWFGAVTALDRRRSFPWLITAMAGYFWFTPESFFIYFAVLLAEFLCLLLFPANKVGQSYYLPATVFTAAIIMRGLFLVFSGISDMLLVITLTESILAAGFSSILFRAFEVWQLFDSMEKPGRGDILCILILGGGVLLGMENVAVYSVSPANVLMCLLILFAALFGGAGGGAAVGAVLGVIPSLSALISPAAIGVYAFSGFMAGIFHRFRRPGVIVGYLLGNILLSLYLLNSTLLTAGAVEALLGAALFLLIPKRVLLRLSELMKGRPVIVGKRKARSSGEDYAVARLNETGKSLAILGNTLSSLYEEAQPQPEKNIRSILDHISSKICCGCSLKQICWVNDFNETYAALMRAFALADANDGIVLKDLPEDFRRKCCHAKEMTAAVNCLYELYRKNDYWQRQVTGSRSLALHQLKNTVELLQELSADIDTHRDLKELLHAKLGAEMRKKGVQVDKVIVETVDGGNIELRLRTRRCRGNRRCAPVLAGAAGRLSGKDYAAECRCGSRETHFFCDCRLIAKGTLSLCAGSVQLMREGSAVCGDASAELLYAEAKEALMISDGMGSGPRARQESERTIALVKDALACGFNREFAAGILRHLMLVDRDDDIYATVDLCLVDLIKREAEFVKLGAGDSYLCTPGEGMKVIRGSADAFGGDRRDPVISFKEELRKGDIIILASDGISEASVDHGSADDWLIPLVEENCKEEPKVIGERIADKAVAIGGGVRDDITVTVAKIV